MSKEDSKVLKDDLTEIPGVGKKNAEELDAAGYVDFMTIAAAKASEITEKTGIGESTAVKIIAAARNLVKIGDFISGAELKEKRKNLRHLTTCSNSLDNLFRNPRDPIGGLESQSITEFFGEFGSGKTQVCFQLTVNATMSEDKGGLDSDVIVIDTENTFRPSRIEQIASALNLNEADVLDRVHVARALNSSHQMLLLEEKAYDIARDRKIGLIIVDSLTAHFRSEYIGRGNLADRQGQLARHMRELLRFANVTNSVAVVTNQVMSKPDTFFGDPTRPVGGHVVGHLSTYRVYLRKAGKGGQRVARMIDAPELLDDEVVFNVSEVGVRDGGKEKD